jgi:hypothetical protein
VRKSATRMAAALDPAWVVRLAVAAPVWLAVRAGPEAPVREPRQVRRAAPGPPVRACSVRPQRQRTAAHNATVSTRPLATMRRARGGNRTPGALHFATRTQRGQMPGRATAFCLVALTATVVALTGGLALPRSALACVELGWARHVLHPLGWRDILRNLLGQYSRRILSKLRSARSAVLLPRARSHGLKLRCLTAPFQQ